MSPELLKQYLDVMRAGDVMSAKLVAGDFELQVVLGAPMPASDPGEPAPGGWKSVASDPLDPDPLGIGPLDAPLALDEEIPA